MEPLRIYFDYCRPVIRLSALMKQKVIYVMTHDSIGLGEDGPTHQPIEHLASFALNTEFDVFRPCDIVETAEAWELACLSKNTFYYSFIPSRTASIKN